MADVEARKQKLWKSIEPRLDMELSRLPEKCRSVLILCDMEGRTRKQAARQLGVPQETVAQHLVKARTMLAKRLTSKGPAVSGVALATLLKQKSAAVKVPAALMVKTVKAAMLMAAGQDTAGLISAEVLSLVEGVMCAMLLEELKIGVFVWDT